MSKLKAEKKNSSEATTAAAAGTTNSSSRYSASNPESGIFSMSDYDQSENRFIKMQQNYSNSDSKKQPQQQSNKSSNNNNVEYNPLQGVSFKQTHSSDVEIVGVKLGNQNGGGGQESSANNYSISNGNSLAQKKRNSLKNLNESGHLLNLDSRENGNGHGDSILDVVGRGYNSSNGGGGELFENSNDCAPTIAAADENNEFPLSSSFKSRLRQKTMEKFEEKQRKRMEKQQKQQQRRDREFDPNDDSAQPENYTPEPTGSNFGLSISGYGNSNPTGKPPIYGQEYINNLDEFPIRVNRQQPNFNFDEFNEFDDGAAYVSSAGTDKPKFQPTKATQ